nr:polysaccharide pyruvyl transferase family protein [Agrobacterium sp. AGB01]
MGKSRLRDPLAPFKLSDENSANAKSRFEFIDWPASNNGRVIYALTPTANLRNVGDQAQVVAIEQWIKRHYSSMPVIELDKDVVIACVEDYKKLVMPNDVFILHSGGNLGDRGRWSEAARRTIIENFRGNRIVSLPQTIHFSDTSLGRHEGEISSRIYNSHPRLTVMGRDEESGKLARSMFPKSQVCIAPDFVLSLKASDFGVTPSAETPQRLMACLRLDDESIFTAEQRLAISERFNVPTTLFDTTIDRDIPPHQRREILKETLQLFMDHEAVVTDRFHGLIFSVLCRKPTVVLRTVDHKLTSAVDWFVDIPNVQFCSSIDRIEETLLKVKNTKVENYPDFNELYFDRLPKFIAEIA